ncbi:MAG: outer membrane beta-barrel protein [Sulfurimonadaceae bacterium]
MKRIFLTLTLLVLIPLTLDARRNGEGFFIGFGAGGTYYNDSGLDSDLGADMNDASGSYKLYTGYKFNHEATLEGSVTGYGVYDIEKDGSTLERLEPKSAAVYINYGSDFWHNQIRPFVIAGAGLLWLDPEKGTIYDEEVFFSLHYGAGLLWTPRLLGGLGFRAAYEGDWSRFEVRDDLVGASGGYDNFIGTLYLGVEYKF